MCAQGLWGLAVFADLPEPTGGALTKKPLPRYSEEVDRLIRTDLPLIYPRHARQELAPLSHVDRDMVARASTGLLPPPFWMST